MQEANLVWTTQNGEDLIAYCARVSNPKNQDNKDTAPKLLQYCIKHEHWSVFEMANACIEITTTRDIARQILRHRSFSFQEFSQRYAIVQEAPQLRECRLQDNKNRQNSFEVDDPFLESWWEDAQGTVASMALTMYQEALDAGIAKEVARAVLPEGLTQSKLYMNGTLRSWIHWIKVRSAEGTQKEHRELALMVKDILSQHYPNIFEALNEPVELSTS